MTHAWTTCESPLGTLTLVGGDRGLSRLYFPEHCPVLAPEARDRHELPATAAAQLSDYFAGERRTFDLPLDLEGTPFQLAVWGQLLEIPHAATRTYGGLARAIGRPDRARAVGAAVGRTPVPIIVPCHRVIGTDGSLTGYGGGLPRKRALLALESAASGGELPAGLWDERQLALI